MAERANDENVEKKYDANDDSMGAASAQEKSEPSEVDPLHRFVSKIIPFADLAGESRVVVIEHEGQLYHLRLTKAGRLLLTK